MKAEKINFTAHADGSVTADRFPETIAVADEFMANESLLRCDGDRLYITPTNGRATYVRMDEPAPYPRATLWVRLYASMEEK